MTHGRTRKTLCAMGWLVACAALAAGCAESSGDPFVDPDGPAAVAPGEWPGGSAGGFEDDDGLRVHEEAGPAGAGRDDDGDGVADGAGWGGGADAGAAPPPEDWDDAEWEPEPEPAPGEPGEPGGPDGPGPQPALEGGEIDDNALFDDFLEYAEDALDAIGVEPAVHWLDVSRRHLITVRDAAGATVPDATVSIRDAAGAPVTWGRTRADGRFAFFPRALDSDLAQYIVEVNHGGLEGRGAVGDDEAVEIALDGLRPEADRLKIDVAFVIDATGSMSEEIDRIKQTITDIAARVSEAEQAPDLRLGLVAYRDRGDAFVTRTVDFTDDVEAFQRVIDALEANGGGDFPEELNAALYSTMRRLEWREENTLRMAFVVADAPAHHYEQQSYVYSDAMFDAATMGVKIFPIASGGSDPVAELQFRQLAQFTLGHFIFITEGGGSPAGSGGSDYDVDPADFRVERLDDLVVRLVTEEMDAWTAPAP